MDNPKICITSLPEQISDKIVTGEDLAGDDLSSEEQAIWYNQEEEAFATEDLTTNNSENDPWYRYMRYINEELCFKKLSGPEYQNKKSLRVLVIGPGNGKELEDFYRRFPDTTFYLVEASKQFQTILAKKYPRSHIVQPRLDGQLDLPNQCIDVVLAFSVLHHIAAVSRTIESISRILVSGGVAFVREPCSSMGDWRFPRSATPNERGISKLFMIKAFEKSNMKNQRFPAAVLWSPINRLLKFSILKRLPIPLFLIKLVDMGVGKIITYIDYYWRDKTFKKFGPSAYFYEFKKPK